MSERLTGFLGWAQLLHSTTDSDDYTCLENWYIHLGQPQHPFWSDYSLAVVHLREIPGTDPPQLRYPEAEYELMLLALDPGPPRPSPDDHSTLKPLTPQNVVVQFDLGGDDASAKEVLRLAVKAVLDGVLLAETSGMRGAAEAWEKSITATAEHYSPGSHPTK